VDRYGRRRRADERRRRTARVGHARAVQAAGAGMEGHAVARQAARQARPVLAGVPDARADGRHACRAARSPVAARREPLARR
ncbi:hypothetical protein NO135_23235, partial [Clostridioides difficile]|nr:hypothetical protein [Clostridioides difficile]